MISDQYQFVFVHVPKTAGLSITQPLQQYCRPLTLLKGEHYWADVHGTCRHYIKRLGPELWESFYKFSFVRNPWDRLVSAFLYMSHGGNNPLDRQLSQRHLARFQGDFDAFVTQFIAGNGHLRLFHFYPQARFLCDHAGSILVDRVGRYENLQADFSSICRDISLPEIQLDTVNPTQHRQQRDYREFYSPETKQIVADKYQKDIDLFGYTFDG